MEQMLAHLLKEDNIINYKLIIGVIKTFEIDSDITKKAYHRFQHSNSVPRVYREMPIEEFYEISEINEKAHFIIFRQHFKHFDQNKNKL